MFSINTATLKKQLDRLKVLETAALFFSQINTPSGILTYTTLASRCIVQARLELPEMEDVDVILGEVLERSIDRKYTSEIVRDLKAAIAEIDKSIIETSQGWST